MEDGLSEELIEAINKELENLSVPAQYELIEQLKNIKPKKKKDFVKNYLNEREKLKNLKVKVFSRLSKEIEKQKFDKIFKSVDEILEIDTKLKLDIFGTTENIYDIFQRLLENDNFKKIYEEKKIKRNLQINNFQKTAEQFISEGKFFDAAYAYREAARLARIFSNEDQYNKLIKSSEECDSFAASE
ncbi:MAG: hypothetical protein ACTSVY_14145 [Candidatus Helarchaeota archaeon]